MTWREFWGDFDKAEYANSIEHLKEHELRRKHGLVRKRVVAARSATTASGAAIIHTAGVSAIGVGVGYRNKGTMRRNRKSLRIGCVVMDGGS